jgi:GTP cyclohydrolase I
LGENELGDDDACVSGGGPPRIAAEAGPSPVDLPRIARAVREILAAVGEDPDREGLLETPARVARMYAEMFSGLHTDPRIQLKKFFTESYDEVVLVKDISFCSMCEHHLLPFIGHAHVAYVPSGKVIGLSKLGPGGGNGFPPAAGARTDDPRDRRPARRRTGRQGSRCGGGGFA